ncbi:hypothetical protein K458DRAFT_203562 [Lentithecium fluviatile CBS 122367]|uniref:Uncharacterized protein n=1 Tax=Lentithecium fluviatile CBS 122367 TaxID=1168545 RepID=A0A6G1J9E7_9PLEO|nr:hypothetical protein K458DRAFT_203562 [Lentithecium fluviatile CBS 122367]
MPRRLAISCKLRSAIFLVSSRFVTISNQLVVGWNLAASVARVETFLPSPIDAHSSLHGRKKKRTSLKAVW